MITGLTVDPDAPFRRLSFRSVVVNLKAALRGFPDIIRIHVDGSVPEGHAGNLQFHEAAAVELGFDDIVVGGGSPLAGPEPDQLRMLRGGEFQIVVRIGGGNKFNAFYFFVQAIAYRVHLDSFRHELHIS